MADFTVTIEDASLTKMLKSISDNKNWVKILKSLATTIGLSDIKEHFRKETGPRGSWPARSDFTQQLYQGIQDGSVSDKQLQKIYPGSERGWFKPSNKLLVLSSNLRQNFLPSNFRMDSSSVTLFNSAKYSGKHDRGEGVPERKFMWLSSKAMEAISKGFMKLVFGE